MTVERNNSIAITTLSDCVENVHVCFANEKQNQNQWHLERAIFPAL